MNTHTFHWLTLFLVFPGAVLADGVSTEFDDQAIGIIKNGIATRQTPGRPPITVAMRFEAGAGLAYRIHRQGLEDRIMIIDEPAKRGGTDTGPDPLAHFVAGMGACLLNQFIRLTIASDIDLAFTHMTASGDFSRDVGGSFSGFTHEVFANGSASQDEIDTLTNTAGNYCYAFTTMRLAVPMTTILQVNGSKVARQETRPKDFR